MLSELQVENFRSIRNLRLDQFGQVNILGGRNGSGKSTVLEAVELFLAPEPLRAAFHNSRRGIDMLPSQNTPQSSGVESPWESLFCDFVNNEPARFTGIYSQNQISVTYETNFPIAKTNQANLLAQNPSYVFSLQQWINEARLLLISSNRGAAVHLESLIHPVPDGTWGWTASLPPISPCAAIWAGDDTGQVQQKDLADLFSVAVQERRESFVVEVSREIVPGLNKLVSLSKNKKARLYADTGRPKLIPVSLLGDGTVRVLRLLLAALAEEGGVWLVDEIENGVHYKFLGALWRGVAEACKQKNRQLICTTHSREAILSAAEQDIADLRYLRISRKETGHVAIPYSGAELRDAEDMLVEIR